MVRIITTVRAQIPKEGYEHGRTTSLRRLERRRLHGNGLLHRPDQQQHDRHRRLQDVRRAAPATSSVRNVHAHRDQGPERPLATSPYPTEFQCSSAFAHDFSPEQVHYRPGSRGGGR